MYACTGTALRSNEKEISHGRGRWQSCSWSFGLGPWLHRLVRPHRAPREYRSPCQRISTPLSHVAQRPTHRRLQSLMARIRTMSRSRMARSLQGHGSDEAYGQLPADTVGQSLRAWSFPQKSFGVRLGRDPTTTRSCEWG